MTCRPAKLEEFGELAVDDQVDDRQRNRHDEGPKEHQADGMQAEDGAQGGQEFEIPPWMPPRSMETTPMPAQTPKPMADSQRGRRGIAFEDAEPAGGDIGVGLQGQNE